MSEYVQNLLAKVKAQNPSEPEFHQAVEEIVESLGERILGRISLHDVLNPSDNELLVASGDEITSEIVTKIENSPIEKSLNSEEGSTKKIFIVPPFIHDVKFCIGFISPFWR